MGFKIRSSKKILPGVRVNMNGKSTSVTVGGKHFRKTFSSTGKTTQTTRIPGTHVSFTTTSGGQSKTQQATSASTGKSASPLAYKICGIIALTIGAIATLVGLISFSVGGWVFMLFGLPLLYCGWLWMKSSKQNRKGE